MRCIRRKHHRPTAKADRLRHAHPRPHAESVRAQRAVEDGRLADQDEPRADIVEPVLSRVEGALALDLNGEAGDGYADD
jgi:hypothetical protein